MSDISKGMLALRKHLGEPVKKEAGGDTFFFMKLTIGNENEIKRLVNLHQDLTLKPPDQPKKDEDGNIADDVTAKFMKDYGDYTDKSEHLFRMLTADMMKYLLVEKNGAKLFGKDDDVYSNVNNVYAENFFKAYNDFRGLTTGGAPEAEARFPR